MKRIIGFYWPLLLLLALSLTSTGYIAMLEQPGCERLAGINVSLVSLAVFCFLLPLLMATACAYAAWISIRSLRDGRFPPAGIPGLEHQRPQYGRRARTRATIGLILPLLALFMIIKGIAAFDTIVADRSLQELQQAIEQDC